MVLQAADMDFGPAENIVRSMEESRRRGDGTASEVGNKAASKDVSGITSGDLIPLLQEIQSAYGYLPPSILMRVSARTGIPTSQMYGVITFYSQFHLEPHGKHQITVCRGTSCHVRGGKKVLGMVASQLGIQDSETTKDMKFSLETVACLGACALSPVMVVDGKYYGKLTPRRAERVLRQLIQEETR